MQSLLRLRRCPSRDRCGLSKSPPSCLSPRPGCRTAPQSATFWRSPPAIFDNAQALPPLAYRVPSRSARAQRPLPRSPARRIRPTLVTCEWRLVDSGYFRSLRDLVVCWGSLFTGWKTVRPAPRVLIISQQTARALYRQQRSDRAQAAARERYPAGAVIGVVADVRMRSLGEPAERVVYFPPAQIGLLPAVQRR